MLPRKFKHESAAPFAPVLGRRALPQEGVPLEPVQEPLGGVHEAIPAVGRLGDALPAALGREVPLLLDPATPEAALTVPQRPQRPQPGPGPVVALPVPWGLPAPLLRKGWVTQRKLKTSES